MYIYIYIYIYILWSTRSELRNHGDLKAHASVNAVVQLAVAWLEVQSLRNALLLLVHDLLLSFAEVGLHDSHTPLAQRLPPNNQNIVLKCQPPNNQNIVLKCQPPNNQNIVLNYQRAPCRENHSINTFMFTHLVRTSLLAQRMRCMNTIECDHERDALRNGPWMLRK